MSNYYEILGISKDATQSEVKSAYRKMSKKYHPDMEGGDDEKFKKVNEAYSVLGDEGKRSQYDNPKRSFEDLFGGFSGGWNYDDIFNQFGGGFSHHTARGSDIKIDLTITVKESMLGLEKEVSYYRMGENYTEEKRTVKFKIPKGSDDGAMFRIAGGGNAGERMPGDLIIFINIGFDGVYDKEVFNLIYHQEINPVEILSGKEIVVDLFTEKIKLRIPSCVDVNRPMRVRGKGFENKFGRGDLLIKFRVVTPKELSDYEYRLVEELKKGVNFNSD